MSAKNTPELFWARVKKGNCTDCWEWTGAMSSSWYGSVAWQGARVQAHRLAYLLSIGGIRPETLFRVGDRARTYKRFVLHKCDNRLCCNPRHLFLGSMRTNLLDAYRKGRKTQPRSKHVNAKLTPAQVRTIRARYVRGGVRQVDLAAEFGVTQRVISLIIRHESYKDV